MDKIGIVVLMSTYNGEKFLKEQIDSILNQSEVDVELLIRDDGSNDTTENIISEYTKIYNNITHIQGENKGFVKSFSELILEGLKRFPMHQYFAFADQDDIWMSNKLHTGISKLNAFCSKTPNLYTSNSVLIDSDGKQIGIFHQSNSMKNLPIVFPSEQGCSMIFNRLAASIYVDNQPIKAWHDRWMYLICSYMGNTCYDKTPMFYYRLHNNNALGNKRSGISIFTKLKYIKKPSRHYLMATEFYNKFRTNIQYDSIKQVSSYVNYRKSFLSKILYILSENELFTGCSIREVFGVMMKVLLGKL